MTKEFVLYNESLELKELGFDEPCFGYYDSEGLQPSDGFWWNRENKNSLFVETEKTNNPKISAPTFSQAFRWFREKYGIHSYIDCKWKNLGWEYELVDLNKMESISTIGKYGYNKPEEAELACLQKLIKIVKDEKHTHITN